MDLDSILIQIQGSLLNANNVHPFKSLEYRGGNEDKLKDVVDIISKIIKDKNNVNEKETNNNHTQMLRKINLFFILNSDLKTLDELMNNDDISHLIWITPLITKCLLINLVWGINLDKFYCEVIQYGEPKLSVELFGIACQNMKYCTPQECLVRVKNLIIAAYGLVHRLRKFDLKVDSEKEVLNGMLNNICELLKYYSDPPNKEKMAQWSKEKLYLHAGEAILNLFELLIECFKIFLIKSEPKNMDIYSISFGGINKSSKNNETIIDCVSKLNDLLMETGRSNVTAVNVDMYCSWCEYDVENDDRTLQKVIGETAYNLNSIMESDERLNNDLMSMILPMSSKPLELSDIIMEADRLTIIQKSAENSANQKDWLRALIKKNYLFSDNDCIECVILNIELINPDDCIYLLNLAIDNLYDIVKQEYLNNIKILILKCLKLIKSDAKTSLLLTIFSEKILSDKLESIDFEIQMVEFWNKAVDCNEEMISSAIDLFVQNPYKFYLKVFDICSKSSAISAIIKCLEYFKQFYKIKYEFGDCFSDIPTMISSVFGDIKIESIESDSEKQCYINFVKEINEKNILANDVILLRYIMPNIDLFLAMEELSGLHISLCCLREIYNVQDSTNLISSILVMCAQIMETIRWDLKTFSMNSVKIIQETIELQQSIIDKFLKTRQPKDREWIWLIHKLKFLTPINLRYFKDLFQNDERIFKDCTNENDTLTCLSFLLPRCTLEEWRTIFGSMPTEYSVIKNITMFCDVINLICANVKELDSENSFNCLKYSIFNLAVLLQEINLREDCDENLKIISSVFLLFNSLPENMKDESFKYVLKPVSNILNIYKNNGPEEKLKERNEEIGYLINTLNTSNHKILIKKLVLEE